MAVKNLLIRGGADFSGVKKELVKTQNNINSFQKNINNTMSKIKFVLGTIGIGALVKESTKAAMSVESSMDNINRTMKSNAKSFGDWVNTQSQGYGMSIQEAYKYGSTYSNLISSFEKTSSGVTNNTEELMKATSIIASKTGRTFEDTAERIRSGMLGSTEAIEDLGIYTNISMIQSTNAFKKFAGDKSWSQLDFQTQQQIRLAAILEQTYDRYGITLADTTQTRQNQFIASLKNVQLTLGQAFLPIYNAILPPLTTFINALGRAISVIAQFTNALFGKPKAAQQQAESFANQASAAGELGDNLSSAGNSADKAKKSLKSLANIDEINTLNSSNGENTGSGGSSSSGGGGGLDFGNTEIVEPDTSGLEDAVNKFKDIFSPVIESFENLKTAVQPLVDNIGKILKWFWDEILVPFGTWTISEVMPAFFNILSGAFKILNPILEVFMDLGSWLWESFLQPIASWTGGIIVDVLNGIADALSSIGDWMSENKEVIEIIAVAVGSFALAWGLVNGALEAWNIGIAIWNGIGVIASAVTSGFAGAIGALISPIGLTILAIGSIIAIGVLLYKHWDVVSEKASEIWGKICDIFKDVDEFIENIFLTDWTEQFGAFGDIINSFSAIVYDVWTDIKNIFKGIIDFIAGVFTGNWERAFNGLKDIITGVFGGLAEPIRIPLNAVIGLVNSAINGINSISVDIPDFIPGIGGKHFGVNIPRIPYLAKGGIVDSPTLAMVGERGREAVMPLENNNGWLNEISDKLLAGMQGSNNNYDRPIEFVVKFGDTTIGKFAADGINKLSKQKGRCVINVF